jgi:hypothetical protein
MTYSLKILLLSILYFFSTLVGAQEKQVVEPNKLIERKVLFVETFVEFSVAATANSRIKDQSDSAFAQAFAQFKKEINSKLIPGYQLIFVEMSAETFSRGANNTDEIGDTELVQMAKEFQVDLIVYGELLLDENSRFALDFNTFNAKSGLSDSCLFSDINLSHSNILPELYIEGMYQAINAEYAEILSIH